MCFVSCRPGLLFSIQALWWSGHSAPNKTKYQPPLAPGVHLLPPAPHSLRRIPLAGLGGFLGSQGGEAFEPEVARWRARPLVRSLYRPESQRNPSARRGLQRASGSRQAPPRSGTFAYPDADCLRDLPFGRRGGVLSHNQTITEGKGRLGTLPRSPRSGRSLPRAFRPGRCPSGRSAQSQSSSVWAPAPGSRGSRSSAPAQVPAPTPPCPLQERSPAQPRSVSGRSRPWLKIGGHLTIR